MDVFRLKSVGGWGLWCLLATVFLAGCASTDKPQKVVDSPFASELDERVVEPAEPRSPETLEVMAVLDSVERGIEDQDLDRILRQVSSYYKDEQDNSYAKLTLFFKKMFAKYMDIDVQRTGTLVAVEGQTAEVTEKFATKATARPGSGAPSIDESGIVTIRLRRILGEWNITEWAREQKQ
jgi:hypothetical protein